MMKRATVLAIRPENIFLATLTVVYHVIDVAGTMVSSLTH